ncbi:hypothetical protein TNCV_4362851 [Trichonephila clavipes]|nr:hypothetical protein TNCV_4362851 [Trichonephila clavipes]
MSCHRPQRCMERFTNIPFTYTPGLRIGRRKITSSRKNLPTERSMDSRMFVNLFHNLCEYGSLRANRHSESQPRATRTPNKVLGFLQTVSNPFSSMHGTKCGGYRGPSSLCLLHWVIMYI